mmetsp:Transcript_10038/g.9748  ORF Transcript_10038/g.9748 Transcript_10038/m.9748 type:complete len:503 (-) Transcript_10038:9-1517(-)|eukprot:CAMPEP_0119036328 /NCGR_PEP_ID=MMETSP1177-20130426/3976_1 /TAXON_ID=2985 /ORGANISM="Ochromonas sp, Strain CCMP1899" /LENGTH=502 /DNA_ID=CAMNT_0006996029 /DNA_START=94 /DNA_END=1602 /DNA_ORIENTATION=+
MIPLSLSFISKSISAPSTRTILTQLCALQPSKVAATVIPSQSIPFTLLSAFAIAVSYADRSNLSTAIIPMSETYHWDSFFSGVVLSAFWGGYGLTQIIGGKLADKFSGERLLVLAMIIWSTCTALTPSAAALGNTQIIFIRVLLGAGEGLALPAIHSMIQKYVLPQERATSAAVVTAACFLGALLSNLFSPMIISQSGWEACFYYFAAIPPLIWIPLWALNFGKSSFGLDCSETSSLLGHKDTDEDIDTIENLHDILYAASIESRFDNNLLPMPNAQRSSDEVYVDEGGELSVGQLLRSSPVWAIIAAQYGQSWGMIGLLSWLPTYYSQRFGVPLESLSTFTVLPYFLQMIVGISAGVIADKLVVSGIKVLSVRHALQISGMLLPAICLTYCAYTPSLTAVETASLITLGSAASAMTVAGVSTNHFDISPKNAGTIFGIGNTAGCIGGLIAVPGSGFLFDQTHSWDVVFLLFAFHYVGGALLWYRFASDQPLSSPTTDIPGP